MDELTLNRINQLSELQKHIKNNIYYYGKYGQVMKNYPQNGLSMLSKVYDDVFDNPKSDARLRNALVKTMDIYSELIKLTLDGEEIC